MTSTMRHTLAMKTAGVLVVAVASVGMFATASQAHTDGPTTGPKDTACLAALDAADDAFAHVTDDGRFGTVRDHVLYMRYGAAEHECRAYIDAR